MATLDGLPPELQAEIANNLDKTAILALRQTGRELERNSHDIFVERFFRHRSHLFTVHSLEVLEQISGSSLARHVKSLSLVACPLLPMTVIERVTHWPGRYRLSAKELCNLAPQDSTNLVKIFSNFKTVSAAGEMRLYSGLLKEKWLKKFEKGPVHDSDHNAGLILENSYGFAHLRQALGPDLLSYGTLSGETDRILKHTLPALLESGLGVHALSIGFPGTHGLTKSAALIDYQLSSSFWRNITDLKLGIDGDDDEDDSAQDSFSPWPEIVAACPLLTKISIWSQLGVSSILAKELGRSLRSTSVNSLHMASAISEADLRTIVSQPQLVELDLDDMLLEHGSWKSVCLTLSQIGLRKVRLNNLRSWDLDEDDGYFSDNSSPENKAEGEQAVKEVLLRLAEHGHGIVEEDDESYESC